MKAIIAAMLIAACSTKPILPTNTEYEKQALEKYRSGEITYSEYQKLLKHESDNTP